MKRLSDYLHTQKVSLNNPAMEAFVRDQHRGGPEQGRARYSMVSSAIRHSTNLDISSLVSAIGDSEELERIKLDEVQGCVPPWDATLVEWEVPGNDVAYGHAVRSWLMPEDRDVRRLATLNILMTADQLCAMLHSEGMVIYLDEQENIPSYSPEERRDILIESHPLFRQVTDACRAKLHWYMLSFPFVRLSNRIIGPIFETHYALDRDGGIITVEYPGEGFPDGFSVGGMDQDAVEDEAIRDVDESLTTPGHHLVTHKVLRRIEASAIWNEWTFVVRDRSVQDFDVPKYMETAHQFSKLFIAPTVIAFSYANYRNIVTREVHPRYVSRQEARAAERRKEPPLTTYHVLEIVPAGSRDASRARDLGAVLRETPLHAVRRHTRTYTPERPLFGVHGDKRFYGTFWIPPHTRGRESSGVIAKDYAETQKTLQVVEGDRHGVTPAF